MGAGVDVNVSHKDQNYCHMETTKKAQRRVSSNLHNVNTLHIYTSRYHGFNSLYMCIILDKIVLVHKCVSDGCSCTEKKKIQEETESERDTEAESQWTKTATGDKVCRLRCFPLPY